MAEPFKNVFNSQLVTSLAAHIKKQYPEFKDQVFCDAIIPNLEKLELKERSQSITQQLDALLPSDFERFSNIIRGVLHPDQNNEILQREVDEQGVCGWAIEPITHLVTKRSLPEHFLVGMSLLESLTCRFTSELAIRKFIIFDQESALELMRQWTQSDNEHIRRLASEGSRPRLPWAIQIKSLINDPEPLTPILKALINDCSEYVRRSVANNLNDIAKDHPQYVIEFVATFLPEASTETYRLLKHASRTLIKQGNKDILALFGFDDFAGSAQLNLDQEQVIIGRNLNVTAEIKSSSNQVQNVMLDYVVWHTKANGNLTPKVFKWKNFELAAGKSLSVSKKHSFKPVTTRKYYPGEHKLQLQINGKALTEKTFELEEE